MTESSQELDIRSVPPPHRHAKIFGVFDALAPDAAFILINDHEPKPLLYQLQVERAGQFDWSVLEAGPNRFRIEIRRRPEPGPRDVTDCLGVDHQRLDAILSDARTLTKAQDFTNAASRFAELACGLHRHIRAEEEILFPLFETRSPMGQGPTTVMRAEHEAIRRGLDGLRDALEKQDGTGSQAALAALATEFATHNQKEEQILYPMIDELAGDARGRDDLVRKIQAL